MEEKNIENKVVFVMQPCREWRAKTEITENNFSNINPINKQNSPDNYCAKEIAFLTFLFTVFIRFLSKVVQFSFIFLNK